MTDPVYKIVFTDESRTEQQECYSCRYPAPVGWFEGGLGREGRYLCEVCAASFIANMTNPAYKGYSGDAKNLASIIGYVTNRILDEIDPSRQPEPPHSQPQEDA